MAEIPADEPLRFKCEDLENKKQYKFRVTVSNKLGPSDPNIHPKVILAKDPWGKWVEGWMSEGLRGWGRDGSRGWIVIE